MSKKEPKNVSHQGASCPYCGSVAFDIESPVIHPQKPAYAIHEKCVCRNCKGYFTRVCRLQYAYTLYESRPNAFRDFKETDRALLQQVFRNWINERCLPLRVTEDTVRGVIRLIDSIYPYTPYWENFTQFDLKKLKAFLRDCLNRVLFPLDFTEENTRWVLYMIDKLEG